MLIYSDGDKMDYLHQPVHQAGQVSFTDKGIAAWTIGSFLHLSDGRSVQLPAYANIAPVSPCGDYVVSNDREDQLWLTHINTGEQKRISPVLKPGFFNPEWSPGGNHILFSSLAGVLYVYSLENGTTKELTDGLSPVWKDNETVIFHKIQIEKDQAVNSDIYSCTIKNGIVSPLTQTKDIFEMEPSWDRINNRLLYHTFEIKQFTSSIPVQKNQGKSCLR